MKDFYYILGTSRNATPPDIDAAYQKLAAKFRQAGDEQDEFMDTHFHEIAEAYDVLRDARRRSKYDAAVKRNQARQLAVFKLKYLNIAITITFLVVTALFASYVIKALRGHPAKTTLQKQLAPPPVVLNRPKKHHRPVVSVTKKPLAAIIVTPRQQPPTIPPVVPQASVDSTYTTTVHANVTGIVYLHQSPNYNSAVLAKIPDAAQIRVLQKGTAYYKVIFNGQTGYVLKSCVTGQ
jgi:DnaJ domain/Bacterial SH3 domain